MLGALFLLFTPRSITNFNPFCFANQCMNTFSQGQNDRMVAEWDLYRASGAPVPVEPGIPTNAPAIAPTNAPVNVPPTLSPVLCGGNKASCSVNADCCNDNCKNGSCRGGRRLGSVFGEAM